MFNFEEEFKKYQESPWMGVFNDGMRIINHDRARHGSNSSMQESSKESGVRY